MNKMNLLKRFSFALASLALFSLPTFSFGLTLNELLEKIDQKDKEIVDLKFNFSQSVKIPLTKEEYKISGQVVHKKPGKLYLRILPQEKSPFPEQLVFSDGKKVWIYTPLYKRVIVEKWSALSKYQFVPEGIFNFVDSVKELKKNYELKLLEGESDSFLLSLVPRKRKNIEIRFWILNKSFLPKKTELSAETVTIITEIKDIEINTNPKEEIFHFEPPPDVEILSLD